jgi:hypothetical protein
MKFTCYRTNLLLWLCLLSQIIAIVDAQSGAKTKGKTNPGQQGKRGRGGADRSSGDPTKGIWWVTCILLLCLVPPIFIFISNLYKDPMTPTLLSNAWDLARDKTLSFLGKSKKDRANAEARKLQ